MAASTKSATTYDHVADYVNKLGGNRAIKRVLIANNGIAAVKAIRSIRKWAYETFGQEREILFTVMATPEDLRANAEYIRAADSFVEVPGGANNNNYANVRLIVEIAENIGADAVWAGWGHASENPSLPNSLAACARPIAFIGPPAGPMHALGDKIGSTIIAQSAGVPCISWNGKDLKVNYAKEGLPAEVYSRADVRTPEEAVAAAEAVGYPLMIKASEGGGGKGIRKVMEASALVASFKQVQAEVPGSPVFLMKLAPRARHLEVQLLADAYGDAIALYGRDCSVQRRHQKIVEEGPVLAASPERWLEMERAAVRLAKEVGYVNAGTVEYLFMEEDDSFAFLELNPRLQVEHPVTEMVTGVNLPAAQLQVAMGIPLYCIPDIRRLYGREIGVDVSAGPAAKEAARINFDTAPRLKPRGHVIAARITAENPDSGFQPTSGAVEELNFRSTPDVWGYFSVDSSGRVHEFADSQIGHLFAFGPDRETARQQMVLALKELSIRGDIRTTVEYLVHMLQSEDFVANRINTAWLDARIMNKVQARKPDALLVAMLGAVWRANVAFEKRRSEYLGYLERGQYPPPSLLSVEEGLELIYDSVKYGLHATLSGPSTITLACNGTWVQADFRALSDGGLLVSLGGRSHVVYAKEESSGLRLVVDGATCMFTNEYDPTQLRAAMSGKLARYLVEDGAAVKAGTPYAEVEVMKMYMAVTVPEAGTISLVKPEGSVLEPGELLARVALEDPSKVRRAEPFKGTLPAAPEGSYLELQATGSPSHAGAAPTTGGSSSGAVEATTSPDKYSRRWHIVARNAMRILSNVLRGYVVPRDVYEQAWFDHDAAYAAPDLALLEVEEVVAVLASRLPAKLTAAIQAMLAAHKEAVSALPPGSTVPELDTRPLTKAVDDWAGSLPAREVAAFTTLAKPLRDVCERFRDGVTGAGRSALHALLQQYLSVERLYNDGRRPEDVVSDFRAAAGGQAEALANIFETARAHKHIKQRNILALSSLARVAEELEMSKATGSSSSASPGSSGTGTVGGGNTSSAEGGHAGVAKGRHGNDGAGRSKSFMSVSSRSLVSEAEGSMSEYGHPTPVPGGGNPGPSASPVTAGGNEAHNGGGEPEEDADLDIVQPVPVRASSTTAPAPPVASINTNVLSATGSAASSTELRAIMPLLHAIAELRGVDYSEVTLEARQMLIVQQLPGKKQRRAAIETMLLAMGPAPTPTGAAATVADTESLSVREDAMYALVDDDQPLLDVLMSLFGHSDAILRRNAAEVYVRRLYRMYDIRDLRVTDGGDGSLAAQWTFRAGGSDGGRSVRKVSDVSEPGALPSLGSKGGRVGPIRAPAAAASLAMTDSTVDLASMGHSGRTLLPAGTTALSNNGNELPSPSVSRIGIMASFPSFAAACAGLPALLTQLKGSPVTPVPAHASEAEVATLTATAVHVLHVSLLRSPIVDSSFGICLGGAAAARPRMGSTAGVAAIQDKALEDEALEKTVVEVLTASLKPVKSALLAAGIRRITFNVPNPRDSGDLGAAVSHTPLRDAALEFASAVTRGDKEVGHSSVSRNSAMLGSDKSKLRQAGSAGGSSLTGGFPWVYTFRANYGYEEDSIVRHIEPPASANLELRRLSAFKVKPVPVPNRVVHVYAAEPLASSKAAAAGGEEGSSSRGATRVRYFVRAIVRQTARIPTLDNQYEQYPGPERMFVDCLDALNIAMGDALADTTLPVGNNHIFLNVLPVVQLSPDYVETAIKFMARRYADRLRRLRVSQVEFKVNVQASPHAAPIAVRLVSSNPTGYVLRVDTYVEAKDERSGVPIFTSIAPAAIGGMPSDLRGSLEAGSGYLASLGLSSIRSPASTGAGGGAPSVTGMSHTGAGPAGKGDLDGMPVTTPYPVTSPFERQRALAAALSDTVYVYDFPELMARALGIEWSRYEKARGGKGGARRPRVLLTSTELVLRPKGSAAMAAAAAAVDATAAAAGGTPGKPGHAVLRRNPSIFIDQFSNEAAIGKGGHPHSSHHGADSGAPGSPMVTEGPTSRLSRSGFGGSGAFGVPPPPAPTQPALAADGEWELVESSRAPGHNDIGMVAWRIQLYTPQYGEEAGGREVVLIANDITFRAGSFGTAEDRLFHLASMYARERGVPRVYLAANSGARIGLAEELKKLFKVAWTDPADPTKGYKYLYLAPSDYALLCGAVPAGQPMPVNAHHVVAEEGEERWVVTDIIGREPDLGVENLRGSGTIAGETSKAYSESFTLSYVTGRTVGIGAYLVRLGQRCIQKVQSAPIILTGFEALNKLMGSEVYTSNLQLGGPRVMYSNGVSHEMVHDDFEGVQAVLRWLAFVPKVKGAPLPVMDTARGDDPERDVDFQPPTTPFDPRLMLTGAAVGAASADSEGAATPGGSAREGATTWVPGLFDRDSFRETMGGWAKSVITGRARLGGIPVGVIMPELRTTTAVQPADPAAPASKENVVPQAGQVWFPDSAFKTAQAIRDFSGEDLPILILANWRGFSGGQRDMFLEVLKYGSYIVDALVACKQPVLVYIPPHGELRGGAWVVVDPTINSDVMEMYSDPTGRGGVLEPSGTAAIKFRARELAVVAHRLDPLLKELDAKVAAAAKDAPELAGWKKAIRAREEALGGVYLQVAQGFCDLHDTPGRMQAKGTIHGVVPWKRARAFFYWRLRRKLAEHSLIRRLRGAASQLSFTLACTLLRTWFNEGQALEGVRTVGSALTAAGGEGPWKDDKRVLRWMADNQDLLESRISALRKESVSEQVLALGMEDAGAVVTGVLALVARLPQDRREAVVAALRRGIIFGSPQAYSGGASNAFGGHSSGALEF